MIEDGKWVLKIKQDHYLKLLLEDKLNPDTLYVTYYDKRTCLLCQREYERSNSEENPNFCSECLEKLGGK